MQCQILIDTETNEPIHYGENLAEALAGLDILPSDIDESFEAWEEVAGAIKQHADGPVGVLEGYRVESVEVSESALESARVKAIFAAWRDTSAEQLFEIQENYCAGGAYCANEAETARIVRTALCGTGKYSQGEIDEIESWKDAKKHAISVRDNGVTFDVTRRGCDSSYITVIPPFDEATYQAGVEAYRAV